MGKQVSLVKLFHSTETGSSEWNHSDDHICCTVAHAEASKVGSDRWQTAPGGAGRRSWPLTVSLSWAHFAADGQSSLPGTALHRGTAAGSCLRRAVAAVAVAVVDAAADAVAAERARRVEKGIRTTMAFFTVPPFRVGSASRTETTKTENRQSQTKEVVPSF